MNANKVISELISKTIIFIDSIQKIDKIAEYLYAMLLFKIVTLTSE